MVVLKNYDSETVLNIKKQINLKEISPWFPSENKKII